MGEIDLVMAGQVLLWQETGSTGLPRLTGLDLRTQPPAAVAGDCRPAAQPALAGTLAA